VDRLCSNPPAAGNLTCLAQFFDEWAAVAHRLDANYPYRKIKIVDPKMDWEDTPYSNRDFPEITVT
jgi:hypothetical protein